jgi:hypothetical protein
VAAWPGDSSRTDVQVQCGAAVLVQEARRAPCAHRADGRCTPALHVPTESPHGAAGESGHPPRGSSSVATARDSVPFPPWTRLSDSMACVAEKRRNRLRRPVARPLVLHVVFSLRSMETQNKVLG